MTQPAHDPDASKGAVEQDDRSQATNTSLAGQLPHRTNHPLIKSSDTDFPEPGETAEHSGAEESSGLTDSDKACL
jgi:hypothetical protein